MRNHCQCWYVVSLVAHKQKRHLNLSGSFSSKVSLLAEFGSLAEFGTLAEIDTLANQS